MQIRFVVPMYESERGGWSRIDGYAGPFESHAAAEEFEKAYNVKYNSELSVPDWYLIALPPEVYKGQACDYSTAI